MRPTQVRAQVYAEERAGRIWRAIALLKEAVDGGPDDWTNVRLLADLLTRAGQRKAANDYYRRLAQNCELDQLHAQAIAVWKRILANEPESSGAHLKLGELYALAGLRADAHRHYKAALAQYRRGGRAREVAQVEARLARLDDASSAEWSTSGPPPLSLEQAAGREEASVDADFVKESLAQARLFRRYGLRVQARARLDAVLARLPDHLEARRELCDLLREVGPPLEAREQERLLEALGEGSRKAPVAPSAPEAPPPKPAPLPPPEPAPAAPEREARGDAGHQIGRDDYEVRYNLGIAYREMGLLEEAIAELQLAAADPGRLAECSSMLAECFVEQEKPARAVRWLDKGLAAPGLSAPQRRDLKYRLAAACEACAETSRALGIYRELQEEDAAFRDVAEKVRRLSEAKDPSTPAGEG
jgi:tetratricopeptide (TPR) repeat protein